jgi:glucose/arabinose dehydrogenase
MAANQFRRGGLVVLTALAALIIGSAAAQQQPQQPPPAAQGRPPGAPVLAPHPPKNTVTPLEQIPIERIKLPQGFHAEVWAHGMPGARMMARGDKGTIFVGTRTIGRVYAVAEKDGKRETKLLLKDLQQPNGLAFRNGSLYVAAVNRMLRYDAIEDNLDKAPEPVELTAAFKLPSDQAHGWKFLAFGPDGKLYVPVGAPCNICEVSDAHAQIRRYNADGTDMQVIARGVRNTVGFDFHPRSRELWFTENGRDWMGEDQPQDELNRVGTIGGNFGFPYCHAEGIPDPEIKKANPCEDVVKPLALLGPHTAALGMRFYTGQMFPEPYHNAIFVARRGSWNRETKSGFDVVVVTAGLDGSNAKVEPFLTGLLDESANKFLGRPVDVHVMADGALLVSDEQNGAIYRITYRR